MEQNINALKVGTKLRKGRYKITQHLGSGGFGITYLAFDKQNNETVVIKEFFMQNFARKGSSVITSNAGNNIMQKCEKLFKHEAEIARKFAWHPNIVKIYELFPENNTWYFVLKYAKNGNLQEYLQKKGGRTSLYEGMEIIRQTGIALLAMHQDNITHRDVKPTNVVKEEDIFILIDFGIAKDDSNDDNGVTSSLVATSSGYAPPEQYAKGSKRGIYGDVYSLGAMAYKILTGVTPPDAISRKDALETEKNDILQSPHLLDGSVPIHISNAIMKSMSLLRQDRYQSIEDMFADLQLSTQQPPKIYDTKYETTIIDANTSETKLDTVYSTQPTYASDDNNNTNKKLLPYFLGGIGIVCLLFLLWFMLSAPKKDEKIAQNEEKKEEVKTETNEEKPKDEPKKEEAKKDEPKKEEAKKEEPKKEEVSSLPVSVQELARNMVSIRGGSYTMGSPASEVDRENDETQRYVSVGSFQMCRYEVTQALWQTVMGNNPSKFSGCANCPVEQVSWNDVQVFIQKLNQMTGKTYRLPTEAEWEYACRAGTSTPFNTGNNLTTNQANHDGNYPYNGNAKGQYRQRTTSVGSFSANGFGLYDMHGNVWEWCQDLYPNSTNRVLRGGSWSRFAKNCRSAYRNNNAPANRNDDCGFRLSQ